jgi:hypothetical protein
MPLLYGRAGRLTAKNGGFWPGQVFPIGYGNAALLLQGEGAASGAVLSFGTGA